MASKAAKNSSTANGSKPAQQAADRHTCEALGYVWVFEPNTMLEDLARSQLNNAAGLFYNSISRPAARLAAADLLFPAYGNIMSSVVEIKALESPDETADGAALAELVTNPQKWVDLAGGALAANRAEEIRALHAAALSANPHWQSEDDADADADADEDGDTAAAGDKEETVLARANLEGLEAAVIAGEPPDAVIAEEALVDAGTLIKAREARAKKKRA